MDSKRLIARFSIVLGVALLQLVMAFVVTFVLSAVLPGVSPDTLQPMLFVVVAGLSFATGIFLAGLPALRLRWLKGEAGYPARLIATLVGVYLPLMLAMALNAVVEGSRFFFASMLAGIAGFHIVGWFTRRE